MRLIPIYLQLDNYIIKNIDSNDIMKVVNCVNQDMESYVSLGRGSEFSIEDIKQRYIETLASTMDFFCGIYSSNELIGILKGRIENKSSTELWILSYILLKEYRNNKIGSYILNRLEDYFIYSYSVKNIYVLAIETNQKGQNFWINNKYIKKRIIKNILDNGNTDMLVYGKEFL